MNAELASGYFNELVNLLTEVKNDYDATGTVAAHYDIKIKDILTKIFGDSNGVPDCYSVILTPNTDKALFGVRVYPVISQTEALTLLLKEDDMKFSRFNVEIDLGLFKTLNAMEVAAYVVEDVATVMSDVAVNNIRAVIECLLTQEGEVLNIENSVAYTQILIFGIKSFLTRVTSLVYKDINVIGANEYAIAFDTVDILTQIAGPLRTLIFENAGYTGYEKLGTLRWAIMVYDDVDEYLRMAEDTLKDAMAITGSKLEQLEIQKTLIAIRKAVNEVVTENAAIYESFFGRLKRNGLRSIVDDLYEFKIRLKNCEEMDEAMYILHQINGRIAILQDYIDTENLDPREVQRWQDVIADYYMLRAELAKKKIGNKKSYGVFVDYDKLDQLESAGLIEEGAVKDFFKALKIPAELKIDDKDIVSASAFKSKVNKLLKYFKDEEWSEKAIAKNVCNLYWAVIGTTFGSPLQTDKKYEPKMGFVVDLINQYCNDKQKETVKRDIDETITALENKKKDLNDLQKQYLADIKSARSKLK